MVEKLNNMSLEEILEHPFLNYGNKIYPTPIDADWYSNNLITEFQS